MSDSESDNSEMFTRYLSALQGLISREPSRPLVWEVTRDLQANELNEYEVEDLWLNSMLLEPRTPTFWNAFALVHMMNGDLRRAQKAVERSLDISTSVAWTWRIWGEILKHNGDWKEAEKAYRMSLELEPGNIDAMYNLAMLYQSREATIEAAEIFSSLISLKPNAQHLWDELTNCLRNSY